MDDSPRSERIALVASAVAGLWLSLSLPVFAQESYYWSYAQHPDLSYFDHPPMVAWLIWLGTQLFGDGALGVRVGTWLCGVGATVAGVALLRRFDVGPRGRLAWIVASIGVPSFAAVRFLANPDAPLILFWTATLLALWRARDGGLRWWIAAGALAGAALLSKYTASFLAVGGAIVLLLDPPMRAQLRRPGPYLGVLTASAVFSPVVIWNVRNDFASFRFQTANRYEHAEFEPIGFLRCVGEQFGMIHPVVAVLLPLALIWLARRARGRDVRAVWIFAFGCPLPVYLLLNAFWMTAKVNWFTPAYIALIAGVIVWWTESGWPQAHLRAARAARLGLAVVWIVLPLSPLLTLLPSGRGSSWVGWEEVAERAASWAREIDSRDAVLGDVFVFGWDYKDSAQLYRGLVTTRSADATNSTPTVLAQNVFGLRALQFDHWTDPAAHIGQDAVFVLPHPGRRAEVALEYAGKVFASIEPLEHVEIERWGRVVFDVGLYHCHRYLGPPR